MWTEEDKWNWIQTLRGELRVARYSRYPVVLVRTAAHEKRELWEAVAQELPLAFLDIQEVWDQPDFVRACGAWPTLVDWVRDQARAKPEGILIMGLDAVLTRWSSEEHEWIFRKLLKSEIFTPDTREAVPCVIISALAYHYQLPQDPQNFGRLVELEE